MNKVFVNPANIADNAALRVHKQHEKMKPVIVVVRGNGKHEYGFDCDIKGPSRVVYKPDEISVRVWIETESEVVIT